MKKINKVLYWITLIPPLVEWVKKIIKEVNDEKIKEKEQAQREAFEKANHGEVDI